MNSTVKFWVIFGNQHDKPYTQLHKHRSYDRAVTEAQRLAREYPTVTFVVMEAVSTVSVAEVPIKVERLQ